MPSDMSTNPASGEPKNGDVIVNRIRLRYLDWGGDGPPIVLLHATGFLGAIYRPIAQALTAIGHVYSYDQRGHGDSERPGNDIYGWDILFGNGHVERHGTSDIQHIVAQRRNALHHCGVRRRLELYWVYVRGVDADSRNAEYHGECQSIDRDCTGRADWHHDGQRGSLIWIQSAGKLRLLRIASGEHLHVHAPLGHTGRERCGDDNAHDSDRRRHGLADEAGAIWYAGTG